MGNVRPLNREKYGVSKNRFQELYYWCLQYQEWKEELRNRTDTVRSVNLSDLPKSRKGGSDPTQQLAFRRVQLEQNCRIIEQTAAEADPDISKYLIKAVTEENVTFQYLRMVMDMPCGKKMYYDRRRKFYWLLDQKKSS